MGQIHKKCDEREAVTLESNGQKVFAIFHVPKNFQPPFPAVLLCHGFGGNKSGKSRLFVKLSERLAEAGIASLRFDFRGAGDSEGSFQETTIQTLLQDAEAAFHFLSQHAAIDSRRLGLLGRSLGGMIAILTAPQCGGIKALALWAPVFDAKPWFSKTGQEVKQFEHLGERLHQDFITQFALVDTQAALEVLDSVPLLHIQGEQDKAVEKYHVEQYEKTRKDVAPITKFILLEKMDHEFSDPEKQELILKETVAHFLKYL